MSGGQDDRPNFTALEAAIFNNGTHEERMQVLWNVCDRALGIPSRLVDSVDTNYSSARLDYEHYKSKR